MAENREIFEDENKIHTVIAPDIAFTGRLVFKNSLKIKGNFHGKIESEGHLIIGRDADVHADVVSQTVSISGKVKGKIRARKEIELFSNSETSGDLVTPELTIEKGARFNGTANMQGK
jgi:cytoskeletal protein CcmA (bactofilin family)